MPFDDNLILSTPIHLTKIFNICTYVPSFQHSGIQINSIDIQSISVQSVNRQAERGGKYRIHTLIRLEDAGRREKGGDMEPGGGHMRQGAGCKGEAGRRGKGNRQRVKRKREEGRHLMRSKQRTEHTRPKKS
jgi:hypothetical protein